ncbi:MAG TPA: hypothetical protein VIM61_10870 [Chthoniobacterales bacterium]|jgi:hypothetical protein
MNTASRRLLGILSLATLLVLVAGCIAFRPDSYSATEAFKKQALALMAEAGKPASDHVIEIATVRRDLDQRLADERARPGNEQIVAMWTILADPQRDLLAGYLQTWEARGTLSPALIAGKQDQVARALDKILVLEKSKPQ